MYLPELTLCIQHLPLKHEKNDSVSQNYIMQYFLCMRIYMAAVPPHQDMLQVEILLSPLNKSIARAETLWIWMECNKYMSSWKCAVLAEVPAGYHMQDKQCICILVKPVFQAMATYNLFCQKMFPWEFVVANARSRSSGCWLIMWNHGSVSSHYTDVIMRVMASQITSV